jgi:hypothetical protein
MKMAFYGLTLFAACLLALPCAAQTNTGIDTPGGTGSLPFSIQGAQVMTLTASGLSIAMGATAPSQALDVNGYFRLRSINGEGGTIDLDGANGVTMWIENLNGTFRLINSPWNAQLFSVDQSGNTSTNGNLTVGGNGNFVGSSLTVGNGGAGVLHLYGSQIYDTGNSLHLYGGGNLVYADQPVVLPAASTVGSSCSPAGALAYDAGNDTPIYCSSSGTWKKTGGGKPSSITTYSAVNSGKNSSVFDLCVVSDAAFSTDSNRLNGACQVYQNGDGTWHLNAGIGGIGTSTCQMICMNF